MEQQNGQSNAAAAGSGSGRGHSNAVGARGGGAAAGGREVKYAASYQILGSDTARVAEIDWI